MGWSWRKRKPKTGQEALLSYLWSVHGGITTVAKLLGVHVQAPVNWRKRKGVPLSLCGEVAKKLDLNSTQVFGLNYMEVSKYKTGTPVPWENVVKSFRFSPEAERQILSLPCPEISSTLE